MTASWRTWPVAVWRAARRYAAALRTGLAMRSAWLRARRQALRQGGAAGRAAIAAAHDRNAGLLTGLCSANGALWCKLAQFMSCRPDLLPRQYVERLAVLQDQAAPVPFSALAPNLQACLGPRWRERFGRIDETPVATGSIGQVHRAWLADGRAVALKIRLPAVCGDFQADTLLLRLCARLLARRLPMVDLRQVAAELVRATAAELDFTIERDNLQQFAAKPMHARIRVPRVVPELCGSAVLVTEWVAGERLGDVIARERPRARDLLGVLMDSYIVQITRNGYYHVDPHPGNFLVDAESNVWILDFGAVGQLSASEIAHYRLLLLRLLKLSRVELAPLLRDAGFTATDQQIRAVSQFLLGDAPGRNAGQQLADVMLALRQHRIGIPDSFVLLVRVLITLGGFMQLHAVRFDVRAIAAGIAGRVSTPMPQ